MKIGKYTYLGLLILGALTFAGCGSSQIELTKDDARVSGEYNKEAQEKNAEDQLELPIVEESKQDDEPEDIREIRSNMTQEEKLLGAAFLGYDQDFKESEEWKKYLEVYPGLESVFEQHYVEYAGSELYAIIPPEKGWKLSIHEFTYNEDLITGEEGKCLYESEEGEPVILRCNVSEIISNVRVTLSSGDKKEEWMPAISLRDSSLITQPWMYDFSLNEISAEEYYLFGKVGQWECQSNTHGESDTYVYQYSMIFNTELGEDQGDLGYSYQCNEAGEMDYLNGCYFNMGPDDELENAWRYQFVLYLPGGQEKRGIIKMLLQDDTLLIENVSGDSFFLNSEITSETFKFQTFDECLAPDESPEQICFDTLNEIVEIQDYLMQGMSICYDNTTEIIDGEECYVFAVGTDHEDQFVREAYYAVSLDRSVYCLDPITGEWHTVAFG